MMRMAFALLPSLQIGARIQKSLEHLFWQSVVIGIAATFVLAALVFGLVAVYGALVTAYAFSPFQAAALMALTLLLIGLLILMALPLSRSRRRHQGAAMIPGQTAGMVTQSVELVDQSLGTVMQQLGPLPLVAIAFAAGVLASRR
jgi:hypothetical protein